MTTSRPKPNSITSFLICFSLQCPLWVNKYPLAISPARNLVIALYSLLSFIFTTVQAPSLLSYKYLSCPVSSVTSPENNAILLDKVFCSNGSISNHQFSAESSKSSFWDPNLIVIRTQPQQSMLIYCLHRQKEAGSYLPTFPSFQLP